MVLSALVQNSTSCWGTVFIPRSCFNQGEQTASVQNAEIQTEMTEKIYTDYREICTAKQQGG